MFSLQKDQFILLQRKWKSGGLILVFVLGQTSFNLHKEFFLNPWWYSDHRLWQRYLFPATRWSSGEELMRCTQYSVANALLLTFPVVGRALSLWYCHSICSFNVCRPRSCFPLPYSSSDSGKAHSFSCGLQLCKNFPGSSVAVCINTLRGGV